MQWFSCMHIDSLAEGCEDLWKLQKTCLFLFSLVVTDENCLHFQQQSFRSRGVIVARHAVSLGRHLTYLCSSVQSGFAKRPPPKDPDRNVMQLLLFAIKRARRGSLTDHRPATQIWIQRVEMSLVVLQWHFCLDSCEAVPVMEIIRTGLTTTLCKSLLQNRSHV